MDSQDKPQRMINSRIADLRQLSPAQRLEKVLEHSTLAAHYAKDFSGDDDQSALSIALAEGMIENVVGKFELPLGIAANFGIDNKDYLIPMAVEEPFSTA